MLLMGCEYMRPLQYASPRSCCSGRMAFITLFFLLSWWGCYAQQTLCNADSVMLRVYRFGQQEAANKSGFETELYAQHYLRTHRKGILARYIPGMIKMEKADNEYFGELLARYQYHPLGNIDKKIIANYSTMPYLHIPRDRWIGRYSFSIYSTNFFSDNVLSPFNHRNKGYYRYRVNNTYTYAGRQIANIGVEPRVWNMQLVRGTADIDVLSGEVKRFAFYFNHGWTSMHFSAEMGEKGLTRTLPKHITLLSEVNLFGNRMHEQFNVSIQYKELKPAPPAKEVATEHADRYDLTSTHLLLHDTSGIIRTKAYFDSHRPTRLLPEQQAIYEADSLKRLLQQQDTTKKEQQNERVELLKETSDIIFDSHTVNIGKNGVVKLPPILTPAMVGWSKSKGFSLQTRFQLKWQAGRYNALAFSPRVGYNFKQKQVYWRLPLDLQIIPRLNGRISIEATGGDHIYNSQQAEEVSQNLAGESNYDSLLHNLQSHKFHYYRDNRVFANFSISPTAGLTLQTGLRYNHRTLIHWDETTQATGMRRRLTNLSPRLQVIWTPAQYYYRDGKRRIPIRSKWPTFMLDYERSLPGIDAHTSYERIEFDAKYHKPMHALRSLYFRVGAGGYLQRSHNCFLYYDYFKHSFLPVGVSDEMSGQFQLLDERWYNESDYYVRLSTAFESPMLLLSRIKWLTRFISRERIYCNLLNVRSLPIYTEFGYGLSLPLLNLGAFVSVAGKGQTAVGCNVVFHWGD